MNVTNVDEVSAINIMATATPVARSTIIFKDARNSSSAIRISRPMFFKCLATVLVFFIDSDEWSSASSVRAQDGVGMHSNNYDSVLVFSNINIGNPQLCVHIYQVDPSPIIKAS